MKLGIIGLGNMGSALIDGVIKKKLCSSQEVAGFDVLPEKVKTAEAKFNIIFKELQELCNFADILIFAVKPQDLSPLLEKIKHKIKNQILLSICAGMNIGLIEGIVGADKKIVRVMPNTPLMISEGASAIAFNSQIQESDKNFVLSIFKGIGLAIEIQENRMDAVTGLSGSGPAYVFLFIEALADGGVKSGLPRDIALKLAAQTVLGSAKLYLESDLHPGQLKDMVTSPAGTTIEGISVLERNAFRGSVIDAVFEASNRSKALGESG